MTYYGIWNKLLNEWATGWDSGMTLGLPEFDCVLLVSANEQKLKQLHSMYFQPFNAYEVRLFPGTVEPKGNTNG